MLPVRFMCGVVGGNWGAMLLGCNVVILWLGYDQKYAKPLVELTDGIEGWNSSSSFWVGALVLVGWQSFA